MLNSGIKIQNTVKLLQEVYYGSTPQKRMEATILIGDGSAFAAFKRWLIRDNKETYSELLVYID